MKRVCISCGKQFDDHDSLACPHCLYDNCLNNKTVKDVHLIHQNAHNHITEETDRKNSGLVFLVLGLIFLVIAVLFFFLSFKFNPIRERVFQPTSLEFICSMLCLAFSLFGITFGLVKLITANIRIKFYRSVIQNIKIQH